MPVFSFSLGDALPAACRGGAVTIGNFDGVHLGHQALLAEASAQAGACSGPAVAIAFAPHPLQILRPEHFQPELTTTAYRAELLQAHGADHVVIVQTTRDLLQWTAREFFDRFIRGQLAASGVVEGVNFGFGRNRQGSVETLKEFATEAGIAVVIVPPRAWGGKPISSSRVRHALEDGDVRLAWTLLGRPYRLAGKVAGGQGRGQKLGFPTANLHDLATLIPGDGVYAVRVWHEGHAWPGAANLGANPTFGEHARKVEIHLIGFQGDLYGQTLTVEFLEKLRDTQPFAGPAELVAQLKEDIVRAREVDDSPAS